MIGARLAAVLLAFPAFTAPVVDEAGVVHDSIEQSVSAQLEDYRRRSGNQVAVAVIRTTGDESLEDYSIDLAREWGVGTRGEDNGVLLLIAMEDRRIRIEVGRGVEDELTDLESGRIISERLVPLLRVGDIGTAVQEGTQAIRQALGDTTVGELPPTLRVDESERSDDGGGGGGFGALLPLLAFGIFGLSALGGRRGRRMWGGGMPIFWGGGFGGGHDGGGFGSSSSDSGGGGFGGGGFSGGGGGGFGGGGASGSW